MYRLPVAAFRPKYQSLNHADKPLHIEVHDYAMSYVRPHSMCFHTHTHMTPHRQSYDIEIALKVQGTDVSVTSSYDLKNPNFRYMSAPSMVPGTLHTNPMEAYFENLTPQTTGGSNSSTPQPLLGIPPKTDSQNLVNGGGGLLPTPPGSHVEPSSPYQHIPIATHMVPMSQQTFHSSASGGHYMGSPNQMLYAVTSVGGPAAMGSGLMYKYQQLHPVSHPTSGGYQQQAVYSHS